MDARAARLAGPTPRLTAGFVVLAGLAAAAPAGARTLQVGPGQAYPTIAAAAAAAADGDTVQIAAGTYREEVVWRQNDLTIEGVGGPVVLDRTGLPLANQGGKGIFILDGANPTILGLTFVGASCSSANGAGLRWQGAGTLTVRGCAFLDNEDGILGGNHPDNVALIEGCEFAGNGRGDVGYTHNVYIGEIDTLTFRGNHSHALAAGTPDIGHLFKSRARRNLVLYNRLTAEDAHASYELQLPEGGTAYVIGNLIQQGRLGPNRTIVSIGGDGPQWPGSHVFLVNNTIVNDDTGGTFVSAASAAITLDVVNNLLVGPGTAVSGGTVARMAGNLATTSDALASAATYDYHLAPGSPAIDAGVDPGADGAMPLAPTSQYLHPRGVEPRPAAGALDVGAYERAPEGAGADAASGGGDAASGGGDAGDAGGAAGAPGGCCRVGAAPGPGAGGELLAAALALRLVRRGRRRRAR